MTTFSLTTLSRPGLRLSPLRALMALDARYRQHRALAKLDTDGLADIGLTKAQADAEARSVKWDVPLHWQR